MSDTIDSNSGRTCSWWRWIPLIALPIAFFAVVWAFWPSKTQSPVFEDPRIGAEADKQLEDIEQKRKQAADAVRDELKKRQDELHRHSQTAPAGALRDELLRGATGDD